MRDIEDRGTHIRVVLRGDQDPDHIDEMFAEIRQRVPAYAGKPLLMICDPTALYSGQRITVAYERLGANLQLHRTRMAMVVGQDSQYGLCRMISAYTADADDEPRLLPFRDEAAALAWLCAEDG